MPALTAAAASRTPGSADSHPGRPQRAPPPACSPHRAAPGGRKWGGGPRGGAESTFPLKPRRNVGGFPEIRPWPPAGPPAPHLDLLPRERREGRVGSPGGPRSIPPSASAPGSLLEQKEGRRQSNLFPPLGRPRPAVQPLLPQFPPPQDSGVLLFFFALGDASYPRRASTPNLAVFCCSCHLDRHPWPPCASVSSSANWEMLLVPPYRFITRKCLGKVLFAINAGR